MDTVATSLPESISRPNGSAICTLCGACCNGAIFARVSITGDEIAMAQNAGLGVFEKDGKTAFPQPCAAHQNGRCSIYQIRPKPCQNFQCRLLTRYLDGEISVEQATSLVALVAAASESIIKKCRTSAPASSISEQDKSKADLDDTWHDADLRNNADEFYSDLTTLTNTLRDHFSLFKTTRQQPGELPSLTQLYVYVTETCDCACDRNLAAIYSGRRKARFLSPESLESAIIEAKPLGLTSLKWTGGEPTLHPDFPKLLAVQKKHELRGALETNGLYLSHELASLLVASGVTDVAVGLDGARRETHDAIRGMHGAYDRVMAGIEQLIAVGLRPRLVITLMQRNAGEVDEMLALADRIGAGSIKFKILHPDRLSKIFYPDGKALPVAELIALNRRIEKSMSRISLPVSCEIPFAFRSFRILSQLTGNRVLTSSLGLLADGSYTFCGVGINITSMVFGKAGDGDMAGIWWNHTVVREMRENLLSRLGGICSRCLMKGQCLGGHATDNLPRTGDLTREFWFCRAAAAEGLFPSSRMA